MKKTSIFLIIFAIIALGGLWAYDKYYPQNQSAQPKQNEQSQPSQTDNGIPYENGIILGDPNAPVTVFEHFSYLCGHCLDFANEKFPTLKEKYIDTGKVKWAFFVHPPIELASAALCATDQDKFAEFNDYFITNINDLRQVSDIEIMAQKAGLDINSFNDCLNDYKFKDTIDAWATKSQIANIDSTPTFFIGDEAIYGNYPMEDFENAIQKALNQ